MRRGGQIDRFFASRNSIIPLMSFLRFLMLLSLVVWLGGLIFLAFVEAPTAFSPGLLPTRHMAGSIVGHSLDLLHYMAIVSGIVFLIASMLYSRMATGNARPLAARHLLIVLMLLLTVISQFAISPKMHAIRAEVGVIDNVPWTIRCAGNSTVCTCGRKSSRRRCFCWGWWRCMQPRQTFR